MDKETFFAEYKGVAIAGAAVVILGFVFLINFVMSTKQLTMAEKTGVSIKAGDSLTINWSASNINKIGIVLYNGSNPEWIVQNFPASAGKYVWQTNPSLASGGDYRIAIFEYPWRNGNKIVYASNTLNVVGQKYVSCEDFGVQMEWPFLPDNYAGGHKVFITSGSWSGKLGGIAGADEKCNQEAKKNNYNGNYVAFLGTDKLSAVERITKGGTYMEADSAGALPSGRTCHRFIASSIQKLLDTTRLSKTMTELKLSEAFARKLGDVWFGRRTASAEVKCLEILGRGANDAFSGTYTCQNWETDKRQVYSGAIPEEADLPRCYNSEGKNIPANFFGAVSSAVDSEGTFIYAGSTCDQGHHLLCIEQ